MSKHFHRISAPKNYPILKKTSHYVIKVGAGPHSKDASLPLLLILRDLLRIAHTSKESKKLLNKRKIMVDGKFRRKLNLPVGLMDVISLPESKQSYRFVFGKKGKVLLIKINEKEAGLKFCKIINKKIVKNGKIQLNLHDGRNILVDNPIYKPGDSLLISLPNQEIKKHLSFDKGMLVYITDGKHIGELAKISEVRAMVGSNPDRVLLTADNGNSFETLKKYVFIIGKDKPEIMLYAK